MINVKFYKISSKLSTSNVQVHALNLKSTGIDGIIAEDVIALGEYNNIDFPVLFKQVSGRKLTDILDTGTASLFLISHRFYEFLKDSDLTGWCTFPIEIKDLNGNEINGYYGFSITGRSGPIDYSKSKIVQRKQVENGPVSNYYIGFQISPDEWDKSDFFISKGLNAKFISNRAMKMIKKMKLTNLKVEDIEKIETWEVIVEAHRKSIERNSKF